MGLFSSKKEPEPEAPKGGGMDRLRARARGHVHLPQTYSAREEARPQSYVWLKEALHMSSADLNAFLRGGPLPLPKVDLLIAYLDMRCEYLPDVDLLRSTAPPAMASFAARVVGACPTNYQVSERNSVDGGSAYPRDPSLGPPKPSWRSRPGWAS